VGGWLLRRHPIKRGLAVAVGILSLAILGLAFLVGPKFGLTLAVAIVIFFGVAYGAYQTEYFAVAMRLVDARIAASMYAILMAFTNIGQGIGMYLSGALADALDYKITLLVLFGLNLLILPFIQVVFKSEAAEAETT
jgi:PAT family beta-lactamase induction signal transducer AmpG